MTQQELDNRKSDVRSATVYDKVAKKFNDVGYTPYYTFYTSLYPEFAPILSLEKESF